MKRLLTIFMALAVLPLVAQKAKDTSPLFPEGSFESWLVENFVYPAETVADNMSGKVNFDFMVSSKGRPVPYATFSNYPHYSVKNEINRLLAISPNWIPAFEGGKPASKEVSVTVDLRNSPGYKEGMTTVKNFTAAAPMLTARQDLNMEAVEFLLREKYNVPASVVAAKGINEDVEIIFTVSKRGNLDHVEVRNCSNNDMAKELQNTFDNTFKRWTPTKVNGKAVDFTYRMKFRCAVDTEGIKDGLSPYATQFTTPIWPDEDKNFQTYVLDNLKYPEECSRFNIQGYAVVRFCIKPDGSLTDIKAIEATHPMFGQELERIVKTSPRWFPALREGQPTEYYMTVPCEFRLTDRHKSV